MSRVVHFEILSNDPGKMAQFYRDALGWEISSWGGPQEYWLAQTGPDGEPGIHGAIMGKHFPQSVINTVQVSSLEDAVARIEKAGGKKVQGPNEIPGVGTHVYCTDPEGNMFGVLQPTSGGQQPTA